MYNIVRYAIPLVLVVLATIDVVKVVMNPDEKVKKDAGSKIAKRLIYAVVVFLVPTLIKILFSILSENNPTDYEQSGNSYNSSWIDCLDIIVNGSSKNANNNTP